MEEIISEDIGEEIIFKLKEINKILKDIIGRNNAKERSNSSCTRNFQT